MAWTPLESGAKFDVSKILTQDLKNDIRNTFYWDALQLDAGRAMTATEVQRRLELMQQFLAPTLARLESEALTPLLNRVFALMLPARAAAAASARGPRRATSTSSTRARSRARRRRRAWPASRSTCGS